MTAFWGGFRLQLLVMRKQPDAWMTFIASPFMAIVFLSIVRSAGRDDLVGTAVIAPVLLGMIHMALTAAGDTIEDDRYAGTFEPAVAAPSPVGASLSGRVSSLTVLAGVGYAESWLVARFLFDVRISIHHPAVFVAGAVTTLFAMSTTALLMASVFFLARSARRFQSGLTYLLYILGGVILPVGSLPFWLQPVSRLVFMSWSSDLLRSALDPGPPQHAMARLVIVVAMGIATIPLALWALQRIVDRSRRLGTMTYA